MGKPPKIVVTDIDEDPDLKRQAKIVEIKDWSALVVIVMLLWLMAATRMCFILGPAMAAVTSLIATLQFVVLIKSSYSRHIGNNLYKSGPEYQMPVNIYFRRFKSMLPCKESRVATTENTRSNGRRRDSNADHIPRMISPL